MRGSGSSPRSWGTLIVLPAEDEMLRFIPTLVGNASAGQGRARPGAVHPHARGERVEAPTPSTACVGSSPRSWGTRLLQVRGLFAVRFIPTLVGNAPYQSQVPGLALGSSPRSWGTHRLGVRRGDVLRFIPTLVGNAVVAILLLVALTVHPHARGERKYGFKRDLRVVGSSPRSWGTHFFYPIVLSSKSTAPKFHRIFLRYGTHHESCGFGAA